MVQTETSQLSQETAEWRQILRNYREEFQDCKNLLQKSFRSDYSKNQLLEVEHFQNQFHIQLINIHDLKQKIKRHEQTIGSDPDHGRDPGEHAYREHEHLLDEFLTLENRLQELRSDFRDFINATNC